MPIVKPTDKILPSYYDLEQEGYTILNPERAQHQDIRELHIGFLNLMPDGSFKATERQFLRMIGSSNQIAQFIFHPFSIQMKQRSEAIQDYVDRFYSDFAQIKAQGLDALIITGANVSGANLQQEAFWEPLKDVFEWAYENVTSILCSCLATQAVFQLRYGLQRRPLGYKCWGVYPHRVVEPHHPLVHGINSRFDVPHSRFNELAAVDLRKAGMRILVESEQAGAHLAVSEDGFRLVFLQGHPEYDTVSLLKEYKREVMRYIAREITDFPPFPENYFSPQAAAICDEYRIMIDAALAQNDAIPDFPEHYLEELLHNTWRDSSSAFMNRWLGAMYQVTNINRLLQFEDNVDPENPLNIEGWR